jgi:hypothetical protein
MLWIIDPSNQLYLYQVRENDGREKKRDSGRQRKREKKEKGAV